VTKDELRNHNVLLGVHLDGDTLTVVVDGDLVLRAVDGDLDVLHGGVINLVVGGVDKNLVKDLEETGNIGDRADVSRL
jgi:hypothetical protein